jgi:ubiquinone/menaquinone biosynthesis C-methylase UbiE
MVASFADRLVAPGLTRDLARRAYVRTRTLRTAALRLAYQAYMRTLSRQETATSPAASASLRARVEALFDEDWSDAEEGIYPRDLIASLPWREYLEAAPKLLADLPRTRARIQRRDHADLPGDAPLARFPKYFTRNFHFQTDGYLGHTSAELYDLQVELLFGGTADAMRRRVLAPIVKFARAQGHTPDHPVRVLDVACGTGHLLRMLGRALPGAQLYGADLSPHYVALARLRLPRELDVSLLVENAEKLPFVDGHFDVVTSVFLFHELPPDVRVRVLAEMARVVRPGGVVVLSDSIQLGDAPELEREILAFPAHYHEPYYLSYARADLAADVAAAGLTVRDVRVPFLSKLVVAERGPLSA